MIKPSAIFEPKPAAQGFAMPAEWGRHEATWLAWPRHAADWPGKLDVIQWVYGEMIRKIAAGEKVLLCVRSKAEATLARQVIKCAAGDACSLEFLPFPTNRSWMRDCGPIFVTRRRGKREKAVVHWHFNAWAKDNYWQKDHRIPELAAEHFGRKLFHARLDGRDIVLEGGGIDINGRGTLLTTEQCYLDPNTQVRNPGLSRQDFDQALREFLGVTNILWLGKGIVGDDTHGHVDDFCRFVNPATVVIAREKNPKDINYRPLAENRERLRAMRLENGSRIQVVELPMPAPLFFAGRRLPASYANFYISNAAVIVPTFNDPHDRIALGILAELFRDRAVVGIHAVDLVLGRGTLHCLTQQEPA